MIQSGLDDYSGIIDCVSIRILQLLFEIDQCVWNKYSMHTQKYAISSDWVFNNYPKIICFCCQWTICYFPLLIQQLFENDSKMMQELTR